MLQNEPRPFSPLCVKSFKSTALVSNKCTLQWESGIRGIEKERNIWKASAETTGCLLRIFAQYV